MDRLIYTAMTGASQTLSRQAAVAHNLANVNTDGYRAEEHRLRAVEVQRQGYSQVTALPVRSFAVDASTHTDFSPGPMIATGRQLDIAVKGRGYIALAMPDGTEAYTRAGSLQIGVDGILQTEGGIPVAGDGGAINVPPDTRVTIGDDGTISVVPESGSVANVNAVGRIKLVEPAEADLVRGGDGFFRVAGGVPAAASETARIAPGFIEESNVNPAEQMVAMISLARQFEMQIKMLQTADANDRAAAQLLSPR